MKKADRTMGIEQLGAFSGSGNHRDVRNLPRSRKMGQERNSIEYNGDEAQAYGRQLFQCSRCYEVPSVGCGRGKRWYDRKEEKEEGGVDKLGWKTRDK